MQWWLHSLVYKELLIVITMMTDVLARPLKKREIFVGWQQYQVHKLLTSTLHDCMCILWTVWRFSVYNWQRGVAIMGGADEWAWGTSKL